MKTIKVLVSIALITAMVSCNNSQGVTKKSLETELDSASYAMGLNMAKTFKMRFDFIDTDVFLQGFRNSMDSTNLLMKEKDFQKVLSAFFKKKEDEKRAKSQAAAIEKAEKEFGDVKKEGEAFLAKNKSKDGVKTTASGLQYIVLKEGKGDTPTTASRVKVHYHGTLIDGTVFDSSVEKKTPAEFGVTQVIKGWTEGLQLMKVGAKYKFFVPQELAYGATPRAGGKIKPFMPLIFEVELLEIKK